MSLLIDKKYRWQHLKNDIFECWYIGSDKAVSQFVLFLVDHPNAGIDEMKDELVRLHGNFAFIIEQGSRIIAAVDKIRSYPVFYCQEGNHFHVSNSARALKDALGLEEIDDLSLLEFRMAGYVTGRDTLFRNLHQLQAGEMLVWEESFGELDLMRYFRFLLDESGNKDERAYDEWIDEAEAQTVRIFERLMEDAAGRPIWVPLSGGLDSRLILCMLASKGYDNLHAFSYGVPRNHEARIAREVARRVGVPWVFIPIKRRAFRNFYTSQERIAYWKFCDFLSSVPNMQDLLPLRDMLAGRLLSGDEIIVNGQSGDFITGGHIPMLPKGKESNWNAMVDALVQKHFSQWKDLLTSANLSRVVEKFVGVLSEVASEPTCYEPQIALYEYWEWQERQCKYVVNGQRVYDWLGLDWALPLWESEYLSFWKKVPLEIKSGQRLYRDYLKRWDAYGLFKDFDPTVWRWPGPMIIVVPVARLIGLVAGARAKDALYRIASYWGDYGYYYVILGFYRFLTQYKNGRGGMAFFIKKWLNENAIEQL